MFINFYNLNNSKFNIELFLINNKLSLQKLIKMNQLKIEYNDERKKVCRLKAYAS